MQPIEQTAEELRQEFLKDMKKTSRDYYDNYFIKDYERDNKEKTEIKYNP